MQISVRYFGALIWTNWVRRSSSWRRRSTRNIMARRPVSGTHRTVQHLRNRMWLPQFDVWMLIPPVAHAITRPVCTPAFLPSGTSAQTRPEIRLSHTRYSARRRGLAGDIPNTLTSSNGQ